MTYDFKHESSACTKEIFTRAGSPRDIKRIHAFLVSEVVERYMREAASVSEVQRDIAVAELAVLQGRIISAMATIKLLHDMYARNPDTLPQYEAISVVVERLETLKARIT